MHLRTYSPRGRIVAHRRQHWLSPAQVERKQGAQSSLPLWEKQSNMKAQATSNTEQTYPHADVIKGHGPGEPRHLHCIVKKYRRSSHEAEGFQCRDVSGSTDSECWRRAVDKKSYIIWNSKEAALAPTKEFTESCGRNTWSHLSQHGTNCFFPGT